MRFKAKKKPSHGDVRVIKRFAWTPIKTCRDSVVWMEYYWIEQRYHKGEYNWAGTVIDKGWKTQSITTSA